MRIIFHIFKKDVRYHWPEALASIALITIYAWNQPRAWAGQNSNVQILEGLLSALPFFLILSWVILITRVVHVESLVGDRQFWITRPYEWYKLLCAKLFFAVAFIHFPLFVSHLILLKVAFFPVVSSISGLLILQLYFFLAVTIPAIALASLTSGIGRTTLVFIGLIIYAFGIGAILSWIPGASFSPDPYDGFQPIPFFVSAFAVIFLQYAARKTFISWLVFGASLALVYVLILIPAIPGFSDRFFPQPAAAQPLPATFSLDKTVSYTRDQDRNFTFYGDVVHLQFPLQLGSFDENSFVRLRAIRLEIDLPTGQRWTSPWQGTYEELTSGRTRVWPSIQIKKAVFDSAGKGPVNAHLSVAMEVYRLGSSAQYSVSATSTQLPGGVRCKLLQSQYQMECYSALRGFGSVLIQANLPNEHCQTRLEKDAEPWSSVPAFNAYESDSSGPDFDFTPVHQSTLSFSRLHAYEHDSGAAEICPGTPLLFTHIKFQYRTRADLDLHGIKLPDFVPSYPLKISPPLPRPPSENRSDTLSFNLFLPDMPSARMRVSP